MYLIELIIKKWQEKKKKNTPVIFEFKEQDEELFQNCDKHIYMPIDSTCDYLACKNCGHIMRSIKKEDLKNIQKNFDEF